MPEEAKTEQKKAAQEKPKNCIKCNKRLKRKYWYYRNGGYYCSKRCWRLAMQKSNKQKEAIEA